MRKLALAACLLFCAQTARADFINGTFETGNLTGWTTLGNTQVVGTFATVAPPQGSFQAAIIGGAMTVATVATFLGTTEAQLRAANAPTPGATLFSGSALRQTIAVNPGERISFQWNFLSNEFANQQVFNDAAFLLLALLPADNSPILLANSFTPSGGPVPPGFIFQTGYRVFTSDPFLAATNVTVGLAVFNGGDNAFASTLLVDNFSVTSVPEPSALSLMGLSLVGLFGYVRRCHLKSKSA